MDKGTSGQQGLFGPNLLREKVVSYALERPEFKQRLHDAAREIRKSASPKATEATIEGQFERVLYATLRDIGIPFNPKKEVYVDFRRHVGRGRMDARLGALVIEYKRPSELRTQRQVKKATEQLEKYILALNSEQKTPTYGFLTDGRNFRELRAENEIVASRTELARLDDQALLCLVRNVISLERAALTTPNLIRDFCGTHSDGVLFGLARVLQSTLSKQPSRRTRMLFAEWEQLFKLAHDDQSQQKRIEGRRKALSGIFLYDIQAVAEEYQGLFALHTAYAIVLKLIAYRVVSDLKFGEPLKKFKAELRAESSELRAFCEELEDGEIFRKLGILNLLEGDFFSWYSDKRQWNKDLAKCIGKVLHILGQYEDAAHVFSAKGAIDLFRGLYEETVPQVVRSSFGEFYTPTWLSAHVLTTAVAGSKWRMLDPCCGSGTFLVSAIEMIRKSSPNVRPGELLATIRDRVVGIDLNPLAVLTARVNYFIHICDLLPENLKNFVIPVYLGDATDIPTRVDCQGVMCCRYRLRTLEKPFEIEVTLPASLCQDTARFVNTMHQYEAAIKRKDEQESAKILVNALKPAERSHSIRNQLQEMSKELVGLEERGWNGIWARIITNFLSTAMLGRFEAVVGNPPWIDWKNLPAGYRNRIKAQCIDRGLFSGAGRTGGINLNVCALIAHVSISNWLSEKGRFAFLMPRELSNQPSYEGWRNLGKEEPWVFLEFHDWSNAGHPFYPTTEDFMTYVVGNGRKQKIVPVKHYRNKTGTKKKAKGWMTVHEAMSNLRIENGVAGQVVPSSTSFTFARDMRELKQFEMVAGECEYIGREGIEFYPQELLLFRYERFGPRPSTAMLRNIQVQKSKYPIPSRLIPLETRFLFPLVKGPAIAPFVHNYDGLIVPFPYLGQDPHRPIEASRLAKMSPFLASYYNSHKEVISKQTKFSDKIRGPSPGEYYGLARTGDLTEILYQAH